MDSRYRTGGDIGNVSFTGPLAYRDLKALTPVNTYLESNDTLLGGYDIEYSRLIFEEMLGLNITFIASGTFAEMYLDMRDGSRCDVSISAAEMDPSRHVARVRSTAVVTHFVTSSHLRCSRTLCTSACPSGPHTVTGDYENEGFDETTLAGICCLGTAQQGPLSALHRSLQRAPYRVRCSVHLRGLRSAVCAEDGPFRCGLCTVQRRCWQRGAGHHPVRAQPRRVRERPGARVRQQ